MSIHQCPFCELRFQFVTELEGHLADEHENRIRPGFPAPSNNPEHLERLQHVAHPTRPRER